MAKSKPQVHERVFYRPSEVAQMWGTSKRTINLLISQGKIPAMAFAGVRINFIPSSFVDQVEAQTLEHWLTKEGGDGALEFGTAVEAVEPAAAEPRPADSASR